MDADLTAQRQAALGALDRANDALARLAPGDLGAPERLRALLDVGDAVDMSLRRWLRDAEAVPIQVRLKAQAAEELRDDAVLAELRQHDLLSVETAAAIHEVFELRRRLAAGAPIGPDDERIATRAVHRLDAELRSPPPPARPTVPPEGLDETLVEVPPPAQPLDRRLVIGAAVVFLLVIVAAVLVSRSARQDSRMAEGVALFRSGDYAEAASRFWRYAEDNPDDATPHLYLARIHRRLGRYEMARNEVSVALELAPEDGAAHAELGFLLLEAGQTDVAVERFRTAISLDDESATAWIGLVRALRADGRSDAADRILARAPESVRDLFAREAGAPPPDTP